VCAPQWQSPQQARGVGLRRDQRAVGPWLGSAARARLGEPGEGADWSPWEAVCGGLIVLVPTFAHFSEGRRLKVWGIAETAPAG
jgi:hypothetical protein